MRPPLHRLRLVDFERHAAEYDRLVARSPDVDPFCSSTAWVLAAHVAFARQRPVWLLRSPAGFVSFALGIQPGFGVVLEPLESVWGMACPFVARDPEGIVEGFLSAFLGARSGPLPVLVGGVRQGGALEKLLVSRLDRKLLILDLVPTRVVRASLEGGRDGFLGRRTRKFRANLRRARRSARSSGIGFGAPSRSVSEAEALALYERMVAVERRSWKGRAGTGLMDPNMALFYEHIIRRTWRSGMLRFLFAGHEGVDVGFVFGAVNGDTFRGLQASYDARYAPMSLGALVHWEMITRLCTEGVQWYDMGVEADYKRRWAEETVTYTQFLAV